MKMKVDYLAKVGAAFTAFFTPYSDGLIGGKPAPTELATVKSVAIIGTLPCIFTVGEYRK